MQLEKIETDEGGNDLIAASCAARLSGYACFAHVGD
jgi:hypothetical protein